MMRAAYLTAVVASVVVAAAANADSTAPNSTAAQKGSIGLLLTVWDPAVYETPGAKQECPDGMHFSNKDNWEAQFPTPQARDEFTRRYIQLGPITPGGPIPELFHQNRGPDGVNVVYTPTSVKDPLPLKEVQGSVGYGLDLDGDETGAAGPAHCAHPNFTTPDGEKGIDNQLYRVIGCASGWREGGINKSYHRFQFMERQQNRILLEITDVDDEQNDAHVVVTTYKGLDRIGLDGTGNPIPNLSYRVDTRLPQYISRTTGKIVNGVVHTEPVDWRSPQHLMNADGERMLYRSRLRLALNGTGATGLVGGYEDIALWWNLYSKGYSPLTDSISFWSPPALYDGVRRHADGNPDPKTGQCSSISAAYQIKAVRVRVVRPLDTDPLLIRAAEIQTQNAGAAGGQ